MAQSLILFTASSSAICGKLEQYLQQNSINVIKVHLDTERDRRRAANGNAFKIHSVPTLVVMMGDNVKLFVGAEHIVKWFAEVMMRPQGQNSPYQPSQNYPRPQQPNQHQMVHPADAEYEPETTADLRPKKVKRKKQKKSKKEKIEIETNISDEIQQAKPYSKPISGLQVGEAAIPKYKSEVSMTVEQMKREREATNKKFNWNDEFATQG